jgi:hypothetical protein
MPDERSSAPNATTRLGDSCPGPRIMPKPSPMSQPGGGFCCTVNSAKVTLGRESGSS